MVTYHSPCRVCRGLAPPSKCALPGARNKKGRISITDPACTGGQKEEELFLLFFAPSCCACNTDQACAEQQHSGRFWDRRWTWTWATTVTVIYKGVASIAAPMALTCKPIRRAPESSAATVSSSLLIYKLKAMPSISLLVSTPLFGLPTASAENICVASKGGVTVFSTRKIIGVCTAALKSVYPPRLLYILIAI